MSWPRTTVIAVALALLTGVVRFAPAPQLAAMAQSSDAETALVYGINAAVPGGFVGTFTPAAGGSIHLLAGQTSVISPRMTEIYFWPITNEYKARWSALNEPVPGILEITRDGRIIAEIESTDYTIHVTPDKGANSAELFLGQEATAAEEEFRARQQAFQEASSAYRQAELDWIDAVATVTARQEQGESVEPPPAPEIPEPIGIFSNGLNQGFPVDLEPGTYRMRLRAPDGQPVPDSELTLTVFAARRTGIGYTVVPESRWTTPLESPSVNDVILGEPGSTLFLEPHQAREYPAREWALLNDPQRSAADVGGWQWVNGELLDEGVLEVIVDGNVSERRSLTPYTVRQLPGSQLGYEVLEFDASASASADGPAQPDFTAFPVYLQAPGERIAVRLTSMAGDVLPGSDRLVNVPTNPPIARLLLLPIVPLVIGAMAIGNRRRQVRLPREMVE